MVSPEGISAEQYRRLLRVRTGLRHFLRWSEDQAHRVGLTATQHQLLLAVKGHPGERGPTISDIAGYLALKHNSAVGLIDRADAAGLVSRDSDPDDHRLVRIRVTPKAEQSLAELSALHLRELGRLTPELQAVGLADGEGSSGANLLGDPPTITT